MPIEALLFAADFEKIAFHTADPEGTIFSVTSQGA